MKLVDRTRALSETVGLADFELGATPTGYQSFSTALNDGDVTFYTIVNTTTAGEWEVGKCTYNNGVISRDEILTSSTGGKVDFSPGVKDVFATAPAEYLSRVALGLITRNTDGDLVTAEAGSFQGQDTVRSANAKEEAGVGLGSTAVGFNSSAKGDFGTAYGFNATASGKDSTALGTSSVASTDNAVALGEQSATSRDNEVSIGNSNPVMAQTRLLANVSDPLLPTDGSNKRYTDEGDKVSPDANNALTRPDSGYLVPNSNLKWDNETKIISFTDNKGNSKDIDLSQFVSDIHVDNAEFDPETSILTLYMKDEDGTQLPPIKIDLGELAKTKLEQSPTVQLSGNGTGVTPLRADVKVSDESGNSLEARSSGLYVDVPDVNIASETVLGVIRVGDNLSIDQEGILQAKVGTTAGTVAAGDDSRIVDAVQGNRLLGDININTLGGNTNEGIYGQNASSRATPENGYPFQQAGTLFVTRGAYGCQQMYITFNSNQVFIRGLESDWNGTDGPWRPWKEIGSGSGGSVAWADVTGKPSTFPPSSHTHSWGQITGAPATATRWAAWGEVTGKPSTFPPPTGNNGVGTYAFAGNITPGVVNFGSTIAGSNLVPAGVDTRGSGTMSGTWRCMGYSPPAGGGTSITLWVRIS